MDAGDVASSGLRALDSSSIAGYTNTGLQAF